MATRTRKSPRARRRTKPARKPAAKRVAAKTKPARPRSATTRKPRRPSAKKAPAHAAAGARRKLPAKPPVDPREALHKLELKIRRLATARRKLEKRLTAAVQEIGTLRTFELRAAMLEAELGKRDAELAQLRSNGSGHLTGA